MIFLEYSSSTPSTNHTGPNNIFDYNKETYLETQKPNHFFKFSFKDSAVTVVAYKITSYYAKSGSHLRSWHFYGSNDDSNWELIDYVPDDSKLNGPYYSAAYHVPQQKGPFKYFLFNNVTNYLVLNKILLADFDIYDTVYSKLIIQRMTCKKSFFFSMKQFLPIYFILMH